MSVRIAHRLTGYDKATGRVCVECEIPQAHLAYARRFARVGMDDPQAALCYKLGGKQARDLAAAIGATAVDPDALNFYLKGFAAPSRLR
jgi:hypothetical protein